MHRVVVRRRLLSLRPWRRMYQVWVSPPFGVPGTTAPPIRIATYSTRAEADAYIANVERVLGQERGR